MFHRCPECKEKSIFFLTKALHIGGQGMKPNYFLCTNCGAQLKCQFEPLLLFIVGIFVHIGTMLVSGGSSSTKDFGITAGLFVFCAFFLFPILPGRETKQDWLGVKRLFLMSLAFLAVAFMWRFIRPFYLAWLYS